MRGPVASSLVGGTTLIEKVIRRAEQHLDQGEHWSLWSHAMLFQGKRVDGHHWVIESDPQIHRKHIQLGVQENRISKYYDEGMVRNLAVLDFGLSDGQIAAVVSEGLRMVALHAVYSPREQRKLELALAASENFSPPLGEGKGGTITNSSQLLNLTDTTPMAKGV